MKAMKPGETVTCFQRRYDIEMRVATVVLSAGGARNDWVQYKALSVASSEWGEKARVLFPNA